MKDKIIEIIAEELGIDASEVQDGEDLYECLDMDSMTLLAIAMAVEQEFDVRFQKQELGEIHTVSDIENLINGKKSA